MTVRVAQRTAMESLIKLLELEWTHRCGLVVQQFTTNPEEDSDSQAELINIGNLHRFHNEIANFCGVSFAFDGPVEEMEQWATALNTGSLLRRLLLEALAWEHAGFYRLGIDHPNAQGDVVLISSPPNLAVTMAIINQSDRQVANIRSAIEQLVVGHGDLHHSSAALEGHIDNLLSSRRAALSVFSTAPPLNLRPDEPDAWFELATASTPVGPRRRKIIKLLVKLSANIASSTSLLPNAARADPFFFYRN